MSSLFEMDPQERESAANMHRLNKSLISAIYSASKSQGLSQKDIADKLSVNKSMISRLLQGRGNPTFRTVADICAVVGIEVDLSCPHRKSGGNIGRALSGRNIDTASTSQSIPANVQSFSFSNGKNRMGQTANV